MGESNSNYSNNSNSIEEEDDDDDDEEDLLLYPLIKEILNNNNSNNNKDRKEILLDIYELLNDIIIDECIVDELIDLGDYVVNECKSKYTFEKSLSIYMKGILIHAEQHISTEENNNKEEEDSTSSLYKLCIIECKLIQKYSELYTDYNSIHNILNIISKMIHKEPKKQMLDTKTKDILCNTFYSISTNTTTINISSSI